MPGTIQFYGRNINVKYKIVLPVLFIYFIFANSAFSIGIAKYAGEFLSMGVGARSLGMGSAYVALGGDVTYGYWNPAGLANIQYPEISAMHSRRFGGIVNYDYAGFAMPFRGNASLGLNLIRVAVDDIPIPVLPRPDLGLDQSYTDENGNIVSNRPYVDRYVNNADYAIFLSYARQKSRAFAYGANAKFIRRGVGDNSAWGIGFDIGALWRPVDKLTLGANFQDVTTTLLAWDTGTQELISPTLKTGFGYSIDLGFISSTLLIAGDTDIRFENRKFASQLNAGPVSFDFHAGTELLVHNLIALRVGDDLGNLTAGAGIRLPRLDIDYAFLSNDDFKVTHRVSLRLRIEESRFERQ